MWSNRLRFVCDSPPTDMSARNRPFAPRWRRGQQSTTFGAPGHAQPPPEHPLLRLQRAIGNRGVQLMLQPDRKSASKLASSVPGDPTETEADRISRRVMLKTEADLERTCPCSGNCGDCRTGRPEAQMVQRQTRDIGSSDGTRAFPRIVQEVLRAPGRQLEAGARAFMERRFGHEFSAVTVHTDMTAAESARAVNALAYTVGRHVVFDSGQYAPNTTAGRQLLAHELTHVVQQGHGVDRGSLQRQSPSAAPVDADARRIIAIAADTNQPVATRAVATVQAIIAQYFAADASKIAEIVYDDSQPGLESTFRGHGAATTGIVRVGRNFVAQTTQRHFARRVLQVRHEIEHVEQQRAGMAGRNRQDEREFIAFYHEATATVLRGTGRLQHSSRVELIDAALGYYYCLSSQLQESNAARRDELVSRRREEVRRSNRTDLGEAPTSCRRQRA